MGAQADMGPEGAGPAGVGGWGAFLGQVTLALALKA